MRMGAVIKASEKPQKLIEMEKQMKKFESKPSEDWRRSNKRYIWLYI